MRRPIAAALSAAAAALVNAVALPEATVRWQADAIAVGRAALRDPYLPLRWAADLGARSWDEAPWPIQYWRGTWR